MHPASAGLRGRPREKLLDAELARPVLEVVAIGWTLVVTMAIELAAILGERARVVVFGMIAFAWVAISVGTLIGAFAGSPIFRSEV